MILCFTQGWLHKEHRMFEHVSYVHIKGHEMIIRTSKTDLRFDIKNIDDLNIYKE